MLRALLLLLVGVLVGANAVYFVMSRGQGDDRPARAAVVEADAQVGSDPADGPLHPVDRVPVAVAAPPIVAGEPADQSDATVSARPPSTTPAAEAQVAGPTGPAGLIVPVSGISASLLVDTYTDARSEDRSHDAIDIMAPIGTPVLAAADGHVEKLFTSDRGGLTIYQFEPGGRHAYYYAHLQSYAPGLHEKQRVRQGEVIGYVGSTGNASAQAPHLHFAIFVLGPEKQWWKGIAINPYPLLLGKAPRSP